MPLIKCPECGQEVSSLAQKCIHCGYPLSHETTKIIIKAGREFLGLNGYYAVLTETNEEIGRVPRGGIYEFEANDPTEAYYLYPRTPYMKKVNDSLAKLARKKIVYEANRINRFSVNLNIITGQCSISKVEVFASAD